MRKGFTLIEILIVVAIIAILASVVLIGLGPSQQSGRDARRLSDLHEVQNALELYYQKYGIYPGNSGGTAGTVTSWANLTTAITGAGVGITNPLPSDPSSGHFYFYGVNSGATPADSSYILGAVLENANNAVFNNYTAPAVGSYSFTSDMTGITCAKPQYCISL
ncbi:MAG: prepilin-type N-terminal cleavage/methylation domain-containing protein [Patescibacteria group bacterium]|nr:prepilin-type N-terminal cleavage/methylation domain-containing protein [Patescibacteria group bacterium]